MEEILKVAIPAALGFLAGIVGSLIAPWVHWGIEKRKALLEARRSLIARARAFLQSDPDRETFKHSVIYSELRPYLSEKARHEVESNAIVVQRGGRGGGVNNFSPKVLDDLASLEAKWELV